MIKIRDYADDRNISYETVRRQVAGYQKELEGHITTQNRTRFLDEWAVQFLDEHRKSETIVIHDERKESSDQRQQELLEECEKLKQENTQLLQRIVVLQNELIESGKRERALMEDLSKKGEPAESEPVMDMQTMKDDITQHVTAAVTAAIQENAPEQPWWKRLFRR